MNPSRASISVARMVSALSGRRYFWSLMTSTFIQSPQPMARERCAIRTASSAFRAPEVLGSSIFPSGMWRRILSAGRSKSTRRRATVMISHSAAARMAGMSASSWYFPDPVMRRDRTVRPAMARESMSSASDKSEKLERVAGIQYCDGVRVAGHNDAVFFHHHVRGNNTLEREQRGHRGPLCDGFYFPIELYCHG